MTKGDNLSELAIFMIRLNNRLADFMAETQTSTESMVSAQRNLDTTISQIAERVSRIDSRLDTIETKISARPLLVPNNQPSGVKGSGEANGNSDGTGGSSAAKKSQVMGVKSGGNTATEISTVDAVLGKKRKSGDDAQAAKAAAGQTDVRNKTQARTENRSPGAVKKTLVKTSKRKKIVKNPVSKELVYLEAKRKSIDRIGMCRDARPHERIRRALERAEPGCDAATLGRWLREKSREIVLAAKLDSTLVNAGGQVKKVMLTFSEQPAEKQTEVVERLEESFYKTHAFAIASEASWVAKAIVQRTITRMRFNNLVVKGSALDDGQSDVQEDANEVEQQRDGASRDGGRCLENASNGMVFKGLESSVAGSSSEIAASSENTLPVTSESRLIEFSDHSFKVKETTRTSREALDKSLYLP